MSDSASVAASSVVGQSQFAKPQSASKGAKKSKSSNSGKERSGQKIQRMETEELPVNQISIQLNQGPFEEEEEAEQEDEEMRDKEEEEKALP